MRGLILRLQHIDSPAEQAVKVIEFYDTLVRSHAHLDDVLRATTGLAECTVGITELASRRCRAFDATGNALVHPDEARTHAHMRQAVFHRGEQVAELWLSGQETSATDEIVLERLAIACDLLWVDGEDQLLARSVEAVLSPQVEEVSRVMHLRRLLLNPQSQYRVLALTGRADRDSGPTQSVLDRVRLAWAMSREPLHVTIGDCLAIIVPAGSMNLSPFPGWLTAIGPVLPAPRAWQSWQLARSTLALMSRVPELTGPVALADEWATVASVQVPHSTANLADVAAVQHIQTMHPHVVSTVTTLLRAGSLRAAGAELHLHHSTVASRVRQFERATGLSLEQPVERLRALVAILTVGTTSS